LRGSGALAAALRGESLTTDQIADLIATLRAKGLAPRTVSGALTPLGSILRFALRRGYILDNPLRRLESGERPRALPACQRTLTRGELARLLAACPPRYRPLLASAAYTGVRLSELLGLSWADIDFAAGLIHVRCQLSRAKADRPAERVPPKTAAAVREIPLAPQLALLLARHRQAPVSVPRATTSSRPAAAPRSDIETSSDAHSPAPPSEPGSTARARRRCASTICATPSPAT
jgi:integrase